MGPILETVNLTKSFGMVRAVEDVTITVEEGEVVGIVGPNGSGKTTFLNVVTGYLKPERGRVRYNGQDITGLSPRAVADLGVARSFQIPQLYLSLTVLENVLLALAIRQGKGATFWAPLHNKERVEEALRLLAQFGLEKYAHHWASQLSEGSRKLLDVALSFARQPHLLFMDEPTSGVSVKDKFAIMDTLVPVLMRSKVTTIFVEHDMDVVQRYAQRVLVFHEGKVISDGRPEAFLLDPSIRRTLLGRE
ncbi:MAG: ABC transporter ATP-binding protein [Dehalococcoidia bacterium]